MRGNEHSVRDLFSDVEMIKAASLRAAQTIKDLLTLGRQGRTVKEKLDLNRVVKLCRAETLLRLASDKSHPINLKVDYASVPLTVRAAESQLARAIDNLVHNAIEAVADNGEVVVRTPSEQVVAPSGRYENIPAGQYAVLTVADNGCGIDLQDLGRVLDWEQPTQKLVAGLRARVAVVDRQVQGQPRPKVLFVVQYRPLISAGSRPRPSGPPRRRGPAARPSR